MGQNGFGSKRVRVKTGQLQKRVVLVWSKRVRVGMGSGQNEFGSVWVRVETSPGQNGFRVGSGWLKIILFKKREIVHQGVMY
ncbi:hypothetical protein Hanom_Chr08g00692431 [Helianthus anomalus]